MHRFGVTLHLKPKILYIYGAVFGNPEPYWLHQTCLGSIVMLIVMVVQR